MEPARTYLIALGAALLGASPAWGQSRAAARPEFRLDALGSRAPGVQFGVGMAYPLGTYVRLAAIAGGGLARHKGATGGSGRGDVLFRFLLDPYGEARWGLYGIGGLSLRYDEFDKWRPDAVLGVGVEGPFRPRLIPSFELSLGGGLRVGLALRRVRGDFR